MSAANIGEGSRKAMETRCSGDREGQKMAPKRALFHDANRYTERLNRIGLYLLELYTGHLLLP